jgi:N-acyl-D-aspartate/D-glutamate deacylase
MSSRLVVRNGHVVDGSGLPGYGADVEVTDGTITAIGAVDSTGADVIDADGLVVAPGFVDLHTHYDAQLQFEPSASPSCWHGVTTVIVGNCGFTLAPAKPDDLPWLARMLCRVEGMSEEALLAGVTFRGGSVGDFLANLDGKVGVNVAAYAGHCAIRRWVMGDAASERTATSDEIAAMAELLDQQLAEGAIGFSSSQLDIHVDQDGRPVPCNFAAAEELEALAAVLGPRSAGAVSFFPRSFVPGMDDADAQLVRRLSELSRKPVQGNVLGYFGASPDGWRRNLAIAEELARDGLRYYPMLILNPKGVHFSLDNTFIFDEYPHWRATLSLPMLDRAAALADPGTRAALRGELADASMGSLALDWEEVEIVHADHDRSLHGRTIADVAHERAVDPLDTMLDIAGRDGLRTNFAIRRRSAAAERAVMDPLVNHPQLMAGSSDGGAHLQTFCGTDYTTRLIADHVPDRLTIEQAVSKLSFVPATSIGLWDRGLLRPGFAGDLTIFDPDRVAVGVVEMLDDFPTGATRIVFRAEGYKATIVNGTPIVIDGEPTGALPGTVIRAR